MGHLQEPFQGNRVAGHGVTSNAPARGRVALQILVLALVTLASYLPALPGGFIWDDDVYVAHNPHLRHAAGLREIWFDLKATPQYYPLVHTTFWIEYQLWGQNPTGYRAVNVLLHAVSAALLLIVLRRLAVPGAFLAAAVFAVHPVQVESVAWITERKNVLSLVFYLAAALAYLRFADLDGKGRSIHPGAVYALALVLFVCALLSKTVTCSLPVALLLVTYWKHARVRWNDVVPLLPMFTVGAVLGLTTVWLEKTHVGADGVDWTLSYAERVLVAGRIVSFYAAKLVWPSQLTFIYPRWHVDLGQWWQFLYPAAVLAVLAGLWAARRHIGRGPLAACLFFVATLGPALGFINVYPMRFSFVADHFQYHAGIGVIVLLSSTLTIAATRWIPSSRIVLAAVLVLLLACLTGRQTRMYRDLETLWKETIARNPSAWLAHGNLGNLLRETGRPSEAEHHYLQVLRYYPKDAGALNNLGNLALNRDQIDEAIAYYRRALAIDPQHVPANYHLAKCLAATGFEDEAVHLLRTVAKVDPRHVNAHTLLGRLLAAKGQSSEALACYLKILELRPDSIQIANDAAWILATCPDDRVRDAARAVHLAEFACGPSSTAQDGRLLDTLAAAYAEAGRFRGGHPNQPSGHRTRRAGLSSDNWRRNSPSTCASSNQATRSDTPDRRVIPQASVRPY
jgi:protein O-mannosyl-transferase